MKRTPLRSQSQLKRGKPLTRKTRLHAKGGSMFKLTADDKAQWKWMKPRTEDCGPCDCECGCWGYRQRCHLVARSQGGRILDNVVFLLPVCHDEQEKNTGRFCTDRRVDLIEKAKGWTAQWLKEVEYG